MAEEILKFTKLTFIIHFVISLIFTILFFLPDITVPLFGIPFNIYTQALCLTIASLFAGFMVSSFCSVFAKEWKQVKIVAIFEVVWLVANLITMIISFIVLDVLMATLTLIITIVLLVLFILTLLQQEDKMKALF